MMVLPVLPHLSSTIYLPWPEPVHHCRCLFYVGPCPCEAGVQSPQRPGLGLPRRTGLHTPPYWEGELLPEGVGETRWCPDSEHHHHHLRIVVWFAAGFLWLAWPIRLWRLSWTRYRCVHVSGEWPWLSFTPFPSSQVGTSNGKSSLIKLIQQCEHFFNIRAFIFVLSQFFDGGGQPSVRAELPAPSVWNQQVRHQVCVESFISSKLHSHTYNSVNYCTQLHLINYKV